MTKKVRLDCVSRERGFVACVYDKVGGPGTDTLVTAYYLPGTDPLELDVDPTHYIIVRDVDDDAVKSIDNWSTAPPPNNHDV